MYRNYHIFSIMQISNFSDSSLDLDIQNTLKIHKDLSDFAGPIFLAAIHTLKPLRLPVRAVNPRLTFLSKATTCSPPAEISRLKAGGELALVGAGIVSSRKCYPTLSHP